jgi:hypothetical protein
MDITHALHRAKAHRQLIFASHNPNIVVNGSAELVCVAEPDGTGLRVLANRGAIDETKVREAITSTMEGGEKALRDRQQSMDTRKARGLPTHGPRRSGGGIGYASELRTSASCHHLLLP